MITNGSAAHDPHQPPALIIVDLPHPQAFGRRSAPAASPAQAVCPGREQVGRGGDRTGEALAKHPRGGSWARRLSPVAHQAPRSAHGHRDGPAYEPAAGPAQNRAGPRPLRSVSQCALPEAHRAGPRQGDARHGARPYRATLAVGATGTAAAVTGRVRADEPGGRFVSRAAVDQASSRLRLTVAVSISGSAEHAGARSGGSLGLLGSRPRWPPPERHRPGSAGRAR